MTQPSTQVSLTSGERDRLLEMVRRFAEIRRFVCDTPTPPEGNVGAWFAHLSGVKALQENANNDLSFLACLLAKRYLIERHGNLPFDASAKPQGASGLDIDVKAPDGARIVGEVKTVEPYQATDFGAQQKTAFRADFGKLRSADASHKYLFVTSERACEILARKYVSELGGIAVILLTP